MPENIHISNRPSHPVDTFLDRLDNLDHKDYTVSKVSMNFFKDEDGHIYLDKTDNGRLKAQMECTFTLLDNTTQKEKTIVFRQNIYGSNAIKDDSTEKERVNEQNKFLYAIKTFRKICLKESLVNHTVDELLDEKTKDPELKSLRSAAKVKKVTVTLTYDDKDQISYGRIDNNIFGHKSFQGDQTRYFKIKDGSEDLPENHLFIHGRNVDSTKLDPVFKVTDLAAKTLDQAKSVRFRKSVETLFKNDIDSYQKKSKERLKKLRLDPEKNQEGLDQINGLSEIYDNYKLGDLSHLEASKKFDEAKAVVQNWLREKEVDFKMNCNEIYEQLDNFEAMARINSDSLSRTTLSTLRETIPLTRQLLDLKSSKMTSNQIYKQLNKLRTNLFELKNETLFDMQGNDTYSISFSDFVDIPSSKQTQKKLSSLIMSVDQALEELIKDVDGDPVFEPLNQKTPFSQVCHVAKLTCNVINTHLIHFPSDLPSALIDDHNAFIEQELINKAPISGPIPKELLLKYQLKKSPLRPPFEALVKISNDIIVDLNADLQKSTDFITERFRDYISTLSDIDIRINKLEEIIEDYLPEDDAFLKQIKNFQENSNQIRKEIDVAEQTKESLENFQKNITDLTLKLQKLDRDIISKIESNTLIDLMEKQLNEVDRINRLHPPLTIKSQKLYEQVLNQIQEAQNLLSEIKNNKRDLEEADQPVEQLKGLMVELEKQTIAYQTLLSDEIQQKEETKELIDYVSSKLKATAKSNNLDQDIVYSIDQCASFYLNTLDQPLLDLDQINENFAASIQEIENRIKLAISRDLTSKFNSELTQLQNVLIRAQENNELLESVCSNLNEEPTLSIKEQRKQIFNLSEFIEKHIPLSEKEGLINGEQLDEFIAESATIVENLNMQNTEAQKSGFRLLNESLTAVTEKQLELEQDWQLNSILYIPPEMQSQYTELNTLLSDSKFEDLNLSKKTPLVELVNISKTVHDKKSSLEKFENEQINFTNSLNSYNEDRQKLFKDYKKIKNIVSGQLSQVNFSDYIEGSLIDSSDPLVEQFCNLSNSYNLVNQQVLENLTNDDIAQNISSLNELNLEVTQFIPHYTVWVFNDQIKDIYTKGDLFRQEVNQLNKIKEVYKKHLKKDKAFIECCDNALRSLEQMQDLEVLKETGQRLDVILQSEDENKLQAIHEIINQTLPLISENVIAIKENLNTAIESMISRTWDGVVSYLQEDDIVNLGIDFSHIGKIEDLISYKESQVNAIQKLMPSIQLDDDPLASLQSCIEFKNSLPQVLSILESTFNDWESTSKELFQTVTKSIVEELQGNETTSTLHSLLSQLSKQDAQQRSKIDQRVNELVESFNHNKSKPLKKYVTMYQDIQEIKAEVNILLGSKND